MWTRIAFRSLACVLLTGFPGVVRAGDRPNFLLIVADDLCWRDIGFTGNADVKTPNLDKLRSQGMYLSQMFTPATTCSPSRHALYTGLYCVRAGAYPNHTRAYDGTKSVFTHLKSAGYRVALQGKRHIGPRETFPCRNLPRPDDFAATRRFITAGSEPWMLVFASRDPHTPWSRGPKDVYKPTKLTVPPYLHDNPTTRKLLADHYAEITKLDEQVGRLMGLLDKTDQAKNTLVLFVSEQGNAFPFGGKWSVYDNGIRVAAVARWPGRIESGSRSDALIQYPDVTPTFLAAAGIDPTKIDTGCPDADGENGFDGRSFLGVLTGKTNKHRDYVYSQQTTVGINGYKQPYPMRAVRDRRYKLIRNLAPDNTYYINGIHKGEPLTSWRRDAENDPALAARVKFLSHRPGVELYDLERDPLETKNLAADPKYAETKRRLQEKLSVWMKQQGDRGMATELKAKSRQGKKRRKRKKS